MQEEILEIVDKEGNVIGSAPRSKAHGDPSLIHKVVHVLVFTSNGRLLLQKRSMQKDIAPGKWDTSVGGHMEPGEKLEAAAKREMIEELGIDEPVEFLYKYIFSNDHETELVHTFKCTYDGEASFDRNEIDEVRSWGLNEIREQINSSMLSDYFIHEFRTYMEKNGI
jgi:isopentenyldiphosphate isomerase